MLKFVLQDLEWYDPSGATTRDGNLLLTLTETPIHGLEYRQYRGMITAAS